MERLLNVYKRYKEIINYIIFGVLTTLVNFVVYFFCIEVLGIYYIVANMIAWFLSVVFAYVTNRIYVFEKVNFSIYAVVRELILFFGARLLSGVIETASLFLMVDMIGFGSKESKIAVAVIVVILNYIFSKLIVFKKYNK